MDLSLVQILDQKGSFLSSGFVFEYDYAGHKKRWLALPYHAVLWPDKSEVSVLLPGADGRAVLGFFTVAVDGNVGVNSADMALVDLSGQEWDHLRPLHWAGSVEKARGRK